MSLVWCFKCLEVIEEMFMKLYPASFKALDRHGLPDMDIEISPRSHVPASPNSRPGVPDFASPHVPYLASPRVPASPPPRPHIPVPRLVTAGLICQALI